MSQTRTQSLYAALAQSDAWKDVEKWAFEQVKASQELQDAKASRELSLNEVCEERGIRKGMLKLIKHVQQTAEQG